MAAVHKTVFLGYSAQQMFDLVDRIEHYPAFLPWCGGVRVAERHEQGVVGTIEINYRGVRQSFTTANRNEAPHIITMELVEGPFQALHGTWHFKPLREDACKIEFNLHYEFSSRMLEQLIGPVFSAITNSFVDSFCKRADAVYGTSP